MYKNKTHKVSLTKVDQINSNLDKKVINTFNELLIAYNMDVNIAFNSMSELNVLLPINTHIICTINTDVNSTQLKNAVPIRYGVLEIIKGNNSNYCTFILYGSNIEETYYYTSRISFTNGIEQSSGKWRKLSWEYVV